MPPWESFDMMPSAWVLKSRAISCAPSCASGRLVAQRRSCAGSTDARDGRDARDARDGRDALRRRWRPRSGTKRTATPLTSPTLGSTAFAMGPRDVSVGFYFVVYFASMRKGGWRGRDGAPFRRGASRLSPFHAKHDTSNAGPPDRLPRRVEINRRRTRN